MLREGWRGTSEGVQAARCNFGCSVEWVQHTDNVTFISICIIGVKCANICTRDEGKSYKKPFCKWFSSGLDSPNWQQRTKRCTWTFCKDDTRQPTSLYVLRLHQRKYLSIPSGNSSLLSSCKEGRLWTEVKNLLLSYSIVFWHHSR